LLRAVLAGVFFHLMDWQELTALAIVGGTVTALMRSRLRKRRLSFQRHTHCGCSATPDTPPPSITFRARKGERPQIIVKTK
jgi:hypothetical protein